MAAHLYIRALYEVYTYSNLISAACTSSIHCVRTTHDPGYVVWFIRPVIIRVKGNYPCATTAAIFDSQNPCNCGGVFTLSMRHRSFITGRGTEIAIALVNDVKLYCNSKNSAVYSCSLDAEGAFDAIPHSVLFAKTSTALPDHCWHVMVKWYKRLSVQIKWCNQLSSV